VAHVLIVDDEPDILLMLRITMESSGHTTALAADGERALARLAEEPFDAILLDVMMPVMDGWGVLAGLERLALLRRPAVIVVSARAQPRDRLRAFEAGAVEFVTKPFSPTALADLVDHLVAIGPEGQEANRAARRTALNQGGMQG